MKLREGLVPVVAAIGALSAIVCCLPLGFAGALGAASLGALVAPIRSWFMISSVVLLAVGFLQVYRGRAACRRSSMSGVVILWVSAILVALVLLLPQFFATIWADWLG